MKSVKSSKKNKESFFTVYSLFAVTFAINPAIVDPINSPKMWVVILVSVWLIPNIFFQSKLKLKSPWQKYYMLIALAFVIFLAVSAFNSDQAYRAMFGEIQRRNGLLTYIALIVFTLSVSRINFLSDIKRFFIVICTGATLLSAYGFIQYLGHDFISWNNPYSPVIGTLGNPNFMAAVLGIISVLTFSATVLDFFDKKQRLIFLLSTFFNLFVIAQSKSLQGLLCFGIGAIVFLFTYFSIKFKKMVLILLPAAILIMSTVIAGMLQKGPLANLLYKSSVSLRGYYWRTGLKMFYEKPLFGVGIDNYGSYFNQYRDQSYPLRYGFAVTSNNAHNVFIQFFATGGLFVGISYLLLVGCVILSAIVTIKKLQGSQQVFVLIILAAYLAFLSQSLVSIDNIGVSVWGFFIGGVIISSTIIASDPTSPQKQNKSIITSSVAHQTKRSLSRGILMIPTFYFILILYQGEINSARLISSLPSPDTSNEIVLKAVDATLAQDLLEPSYKAMIAYKLFDSGQVGAANKILTDLLEYDPRNLNFLEAKAIYAENSNNFNQVVAFRKRIAELNPYNALNLGRLAVAYIKVENISEANKVLVRVNSFASGTEIAEELEREILNAQK